MTTYKIMIEATPNQTPRDYRELASGLTAKQVRAEVDGFGDNPATYGRGYVIIRESDGASMVAQWDPWNENDYALAEA